MIVSGLAAFKDGGKTSALGNPPIQIQATPRERIHERRLSIASARSAYCYRQPTERVPDMDSVEFDQRIRQGVVPKKRIAQTAVQPLSPARKSGPVRFVETLLGTWRLQRGDAVPLLGFESSEGEYVRAILDGRQPLVGRDIKYRIACLLVIRSTLFGLFRDEAVENEWLREPHRALDDRTPMALLLEGAMENLLLVREYVEEVAGR